MLHKKTLNVKNFVICYFDVINAACSLTHCQFLSKREHLFIFFNVIVSTAALLSTVLVRFLISKLQNAGEFFAVFVPYDVLSNVFRHIFNTQQMICGV